MSRFGVLYFYAYQGSYCQITANTFQAEKTCSSLTLVGEKISQEMLYSCRIKHLSHYQFGIGSVPTNRGKQNGLTCIGNHRVLFNIGGFIKQTDRGKSTL